MRTCCKMGIVRDLQKSTVIVPLEHQPPRMFSDSVVLIFIDWIRGTQAKVLQKVSILFTAEP